MSISAKPLRLRITAMPSVCWLNSSDPGAALVVADTMTPMQARRIGFGLAVAQVSNFLPPSPDVALLVKKLREKAGVDARPTLKESWQPDFAFETESWIGGRLLRAR